MRRFLSLTAILIMLFAACSNFEESATGRFEYGMKLLKSGQKDKAAEMFQTIDSLYPDSPYGQYGLAVLLSKERLDLEAAERFFDIAQNYPDFLPAIRSFYDLTVRDGWYDLAQGLALKAERLGLDSLEARRLEAQTYMRQGYLVKAGKILDSLIVHHRDNTPLNLTYAEYQMHQGEFDRGINILHELLPKITRDKHALLEIGKVYALIGSADSAAVYFRQALDRASDDYYFEADIAQAFCNIGYLENCKKIIKKLQRKSPDTYRLNYLKRNERLAAGRLFEALEIAMDGARLNNGIPTPHMNVGAIERMLIDKMHSRQSYQNAGQTAEVDSFHTFIVDEITITMMESVLAQGGWTEALLLYGTHHETLPKNFRTLLLYADILYTANRNDEAEGYIKELMPFVDGNADFEAKLGNLYYRHGMYKDASKYLDEALKLDLINALAVKTKALLLRRTKSDDAALAFFEDMPIYAQTDTSVYRLKFDLYASTDNTDGGKEFSDALLALGPKDIDRIKASLNFFEEVKGYDKGVELIQFSLGEDPNSTEIRLAAANFYFATGHPDKAGEQAEKVLGSEPSNLHAMLLRGLSLELQGDYSKAIEFYKKVLAEDKMNGAAHGYLARALLESGGDMNEIISHVNQAVKFDMSPVHRITLARALMKQGQYKGAQRVLEMAIKRAPDVGDLYYYAGKAARENNDIEKSRSYFKKALELGVTDTLKADAEKQLKGM